jgi:hypothetical protein
MCMSKSGWNASGFEYLEAKIAKVLLDVAWSHNFQNTQFHKSSDWKRIFRYSLTSNCFKVQNPRQYGVCRVVLHPFAISRYKYSPFSP